MMKILRTGRTLGENRVKRRNPSAIRVVVLRALVVVRCDSKNVAQVTSSAAPLDVQVPSPPTAVRINGQLSVAYELHLTNYRPVGLTLTRVDVEDSEGDLLATYEGTSLAARMSRLGARPGPADERTIGAGMTAVAFVWFSLKAEAPEILRHRISYDLSTAPSDGNRSATIETPLAVRGSPVVLGPPVRGGPWAALYDPSSPRGHRRTFFEIDGKARIPARFAIDWVKLGHDGRSYHDDRAVPGNSYGYGADVLAVADGVVASAVDRFQEPTTPIAIDNEAGNYLAIDLGDRCFAFYEHLQPGSIRVKVGDRVRSGQELARVGASGSVFSGPHLHFHVSDANAPLAAEGIPFVLRAFEVLGTFGSLDAFAAGKPWLRSETPVSRRLEMPAANSVVRF